MTMAKGSETTLPGCLALAAYTVVAVPIASALRGWVLSRMWAWFMVPTFHLPALGVAAAIGIAATVRLVTYQADADKDHEDEGTAERIIKASIRAVVLPLFVLGFGWCVKQFM